MVVDRSTQGDLLRISFNISFPSLSCEFATLDVSDALGTKRLNLTKTIRKLPIGQARRSSCRLATYKRLLFSADMLALARTWQLPTSCCRWCAVAEKCSPAGFP